MNYSIKGKVKSVGPTVSVGANGFRKREVIIVTEDQYPQMIPIEFTQDKVSLLDHIAENQEIEVSFNIRGREWIDNNGEAKYFLSLQGWKCNSEDTKPPF
jgi:hypothetical protein